MTAEAVQPTTPFFTWIGRLGMERTARAGRRDREMPAIIEITNLPSKFRLRLSNVCGFTARIMTSISSILSQAFWVSRAVTFSDEESQSETVNFSERAR